MKRKIIFLCGLFVLGLCSTNENSINHFPKSELNYSKEICGQVTSTKLNKKQLNAPLKPKPNIREVCIDCPWCKRENIIQGANQVNCRYCNKDLFATVYDKLCPWCQTTNKVKHGTSLDVCNYCGCGFNKSTTISFEAFYECGGAESPLIGNDVVLYKTIDNVPNEQLAITNTDTYGHGCFEIKDNFEGNTLDAYIFIDAGNSDVVLKTDYEPHQGRYGHSTIYDQWNSKIYKDNSSNNNFTYKKPCIYTRVKITKGKNNVIKKATVSINNSAPNADSFGMLFYVGQMIMRVNEFGNKCFFYSHKSKSIDPVTVLYTNIDYKKDRSGRTSANKNSVSFYNNGEKKIYLLLNDPTPSVIMHEYGHHIQNRLDVNKSPGGRHCFSENHYRLGEEKGAYLAWTESWASVFSVVASYEIKNSFLRAPNQSLLTNLCINENFGDGKYGNANLEDNYSTNGYYFMVDANGARVIQDHDSMGNAVQCSAPAEYCELTNAQILWDVYDIYDTWRTEYELKEEKKYDLYGLGYAKWFELSTLSGTYCLRNFYENLTDSSKWSEASSYRSATDMLFTKHGIDITSW